MRFFAFGARISMDIKKTIENDLNTLASEFLNSLEYKINKKQSSFIQLLKLKHWLIEDKPRKVSFSENFCVPNEYENGLRNLIEKIKNGSEGLYRHQSRGLFNGNAKDSMFYDFGIHHLHLGITIDLKHKKMIEGTKDVAFVYINNEPEFDLKKSRKKALVFVTYWFSRQNIKTQGFLWIILPNYFVFWMIFAKSLMNP